ncbi:MAG: DUF4855 domain-containing protein [Lentisphaerae bacterium]|nr:DUF4855 domain-containing protein [Lentisphaerota bacterium]
MLRLGRLAGLAAVLATAILRADYAPFAGNPDGRRDVMLCYTSPKGWTLEHFRPYVAWVEAGSGRPLDWFFDAWLMLQYGRSPSGAAYFSGPTVKTDWEFFLDEVWAPGRNLDALDRCIEEFSAVLGDPGPPQPVVLMIPYPSPAQHAFGDLDGKGTVADLAQPADRARAVSWFIDEAIRRWEAAPRRHLRLWGFYWMNEGIHTADHAIVKHANAHAHGRGLKTYWIPWFRAPGYERWRDLGFDAAVMQPNFAFLATPAGLRLGDDARLSANARLARDAGLGVEMEMNEAVLRSPESRWNLWQYLNHGLPEWDGTMNDVARAWYQSSSHIRHLAESTDPECRALYDAIYRFHKGTYQRRPWSLAEGAAVQVEVAGTTIAPAEAQRLTDGVWDPDGHRTEGALRCPGGTALIRLDLGRLQAVSNLRLHLWECTWLERLALRTSPDGREWTAVEAQEVWGNPVVRGPGSRIVSVPPHLARHLEIRLHGPADRDLVLDEVIVPPDGNAFWACRRAAPTGTAEWVLEPPRVLQRLRLGPFPAGAGALTAHLDDTPLALPAPDAEGWVDVTPPLALAGRLRVSADGPATAALPGLEAVATQAANAALWRPYDLQPPFAAKYPDSGRELSDGVLTVAGFSDGRTVGWYHVSPVVTFDLGRTTALSRLRLHAQGGGQAAVHFPATVDIAIAAEDGLWQPLPPRLRPLEFVVPAEASPARHIGWAECDLAGSRARQLRLRFDSPQAGWTMLSEIEVIDSNGTNLAPAITYALQPIPSSEAPYSDNQGYLTDGAYSETGWNRCAGWSRGTPEITLDLQRTQPVSLVVVHLVGGRGGGVFFPTRLDMAVSTDGAAWQDAASTAQHPDDGDAQSRRTGVMTLRLQPPVEARFLRLTLERRGWTMVHEVEVY